jgi:pimeloyl-ACP methyl ester carboxylesterase
LDDEFLHGDSARVTTVGRRWQIAIGVLVVLAVLIGVNAVLVEGETKQAEVTVPGGRILDLDGGDVQVVDRGPREGSPIVLLHCYTCAIDWWDGMMPILERRHRVVAMDMLGFGGSDKPQGPYDMDSQGLLVKEALRLLKVHHATVVGHSLGGTVATDLAELSPPQLVERLVIIDQAPNNDDYERKGLPLTAKLTFLPVIGPALWRVTPDSAVKDGLGVAFAPGYEVPDAFVDDFWRQTYDSYDKSPDAEDSYVSATPLDKRIRRMGRMRPDGLPLLAIFGGDEQLYDAEKALAAYDAVPGSETKLIQGAGHSPSVEKPARTAALVLRFADDGARQAQGAKRLAE